MAFNKNKYDQTYVKEKYDRIPVNVKKGDREIIAEYAKRKGFKSITEYIKHLIYNDMKNEKINITIGEMNKSGENNDITIE